MEGVEQESRQDATAADNHRQCNGMRLYLCNLRERNEEKQGGSMTKAVRSLIAALLIFGPNTPGTLFARICACFLSVSLSTAAQGR